MNRILSLLFLTFIIFPSAAFAADKVVVIPLGGCSSSNSIIGSWFDNDGNLGVDDISVITFLTDTHYIMAESEYGTPELGGGKGMEQGTYSWNSSTGELIATVVQETNGDWGLSELGNPTTWNVSLNGNTLTVITADGTETSVLSRVIP